MKLKTILSVLAIIIVFSALANSVLLCDMSAAQFQSGNDEQALAYGYLAEDTVILPGILLVALYLVKRRCCQ